MVLAAAYILRGRSPYPVLALALAGALLATLTAVATFENTVSGPPFARLVATTDIGLRAAGPFVNPNYMGTFAVAVLVGILAAWTAIASPIGRAMLVGLVVLCVIALVQAQSRGAVVAGFAGLAALVWLRSRPLALAVVGMGLVAAVLIYPAFVEWRLTNLRGSVSDAGYVAMTESDDARLNATLAGPAMFLSEPIFGVGFGEFVEKSVTVSGLETGINAHNWYVNVLAEQGITGGILWLGATVAVAYELRSRRGVARMVGVAVLTTLVVGFLFLEGPTSVQLVAVPCLFLIAALVSDWGDGRTRPAGMGALAESRGT
jgi:O-antigen ligase